jgi:hypothetical protein
LDDAVGESIECAAYIDELMRWQHASPATCQMSPVTKALLRTPSISSAFSLLRVPPPRVMTSDTPRAVRQHRLFLSVPITECSSESERVPTGFYWVVGENPQSPLYLHRVSQHPKPEPAIQNICLISHSDTADLVEILEDLTERCEDEVLHVRRPPGEVVTVSADVNLPDGAPKSTSEWIADAHDGYFELDAACEVSAIRRSSKDGEYVEKA